MTDEVLRVDRDDRGVVTLTLNRPEVRNAFNPELMTALGDELSRLADDPTVRAVVLTGAGSVFSAGADLTWMSSMAEAGFDESVADSATFESMLRAAATFPRPLLARVNGHAIAGASGLLACVDVAVAVRGSLFGFSEVRLGIVPAMISAYVLPRIGVGSARRYLLTGERFDADAALRIGLVHEVCEADDLDETFSRLLDGVLAGGPQAHLEVKRLIDDVGRATTFEESEERRVTSIARARASDEGQEGIRAFFDKRRPAWVPPD